MSSSATSVRRLRKILAVGAVCAIPLVGGYAKGEQLLKFAPATPIENPTISYVWQPWIDKVNAEANGEFQIKVYGMSLANPRNVWERTVSGVADMGFALFGTVGLSFEKTSVTSLPLLVDDGETGAASVALWRLYERGLIKDEYQNVRLIGLVSLPVQGLATKRPIESIGDIKGLKIRVADKLTGDISTTLGGSPISLAGPEVYQALSRSVVDAAIANWIMVGTFRLTEVTTHYYTGVPLGAPPSFVIMSPKAYAALSQKGKDILDKHTGAALSRHAGNAFENMTRGLRDQVAASKKYALVRLGPAQIQSWKNVLESVVTKWAADTPNGKAILEQFKVELEKAKAEK